MGGGSTWEKRRRGCCADCCSAGNRRWHQQWWRTGRRPQWSGPRRWGYATRPVSPGHPPRAPRPSPPRATPPSSWPRAPTARRCGPPRSSRRPAPPPACSPRRPTGRGCGCACCAGIGSPGCIGSWPRQIWPWNKRSTRTRCDGTGRPACARGVKRCPRGRPAGRSPERRHRDPQRRNPCERARPAGRRSRSPPRTTATGAGVMVMSPSSPRAPRARIGEVPPTRSGCRASRGPGQWKSHALRRNPRRGRVTDVPGAHTQAGRMRTASASRGRRSP